MRINKKIPVQAGLAGGSTDAAGVLVGLNKLSGLLLTKNEILNLAARIGADVAFCIEGGTSRCLGVGDEIVKMNPLKDIWVVLVKPPFGVATPWAFTEYDKARKTHLPSTPQIVEKLSSGFFRDSFDAFIGVNNALEEVVISKNPEIQRIKNVLSSYKENVFSLMSGSGATVYGVFKSEQAANAAKLSLFMFTTFLVCGPFL